MSYVDAGYAIALATLFVYAVTLVLRRRRWERALQMSEPGVEPEGAPAHGEAS
ncbi:MAG TPA: hypothetical protein VH012_09740 [Acidimicrobiales bacterium]|jgi:hypothetical protein|nr:hypothetical protein [Acidimicrobiales bacterium]